MLSQLTFKTRKCNSLWLLTLRWPWTFFFFKKNRNATLHLWQNHKKHIKHNHGQPCKVWTWLDWNLLSLKLCQSDVPVTMTFCQSHQNWYKNAKHNRGHYPAKPRRLHLHGLLEKANNKVFATPNPPAEHSPLERLAFFTLKACVKLVRCAFQNSNTNSVYVCMHVLLGKGGQVSMLDTHEALCAVIPQQNLRCFFSHSIIPAWCIQLKI